MREMSWMIKVSVKKLGMFPVELCVKIVHISWLQSHLVAEKGTRPVTSTEK